MHVKGKHEAVIINSSDHVAFSVFMFHYSHPKFGLLVNGLKIHTRISRFTLDLSCVLPL